MSQFILRHRRLLAACVALGAIGPASLANAQSSPCAGIETNPAPGISDVRVTLYTTGSFRQANLAPARQIAGLGWNGPLPNTVIEVTDSSLGSRLRITFRSMTPTQRGLLNNAKGDLIISDQDGGGKRPLSTISYGTGSVSLPSGIDFTKPGGDLTIAIRTSDSAKVTAPLLTLVVSRDTLRTGLKSADQLLMAQRKRKNQRQCMPSAPPSFCFLTTATVETLGLEDDCWELETLRKFRDGWLSQQPGGAEDIARYYRDAPAIADGLRSDPKRLSRIYFTGILPSAIAAKVGLNRVARAIYSRQMRKLVAA